MSEAANSEWANSPIVDLEVDAAMDADDLDQAVRLLRRWVAPTKPDDRLLYDRTLAFLGALGSETNDPALD